MSFAVNNAKLIRLLIQTRCEKIQRCVVKAKGDTFYFLPDAARPPPLSRSEGNPGSPKGGISIQAANKR